MSRSRAELQVNLVRMIEETYGKDVLKNYIVDWIEHYQNLIERREAEDRL